MCIRDRDYKEEVKGEEARRDLNYHTAPVKSDGKSLDASRSSNRKSDEPFSFEGETMPKTSYVNMAATASVHQRLITEVPRFDHSRQPYNFTEPEHRSTQSLGMDSTERVIQPATSDQKRATKPQSTYSQPISQNQTSRDFTPSRYLNLAGNLQNIDRISPFNPSQSNSFMDQALSEYLPDKLRSNEKKGVIGATPQRERGSKINITDKSFGFAVRDCLSIDGGTMLRKGDMVNVRFMQEEDVIECTWESYQSFFPRDAVYVINSALPSKKNSMTAREGPSSDLSKKIGQTSASKKTSIESLNLSQKPVTPGQPKPSPRQDITKTALQATAEKLFTHMEKEKTMKRQTSTNYYTPPQDLSRKQGPQGKSSQRK
eukprot:TRINITY_DN3407_c0_g1_i1.p1 TRINITY_DN3407_c0_g1~~TRINITY_DN3407_c0_g1_i1.p1  ORF type:complete len:373 (+),score=63.64 TRINITY_DN3407_c0_g1_i1:65-1183(+)